MSPVESTRGTSPLILGFPHVGTHVPPQIVARLNDRGKTLSDTDWHVDRLYEGLLLNVTTVRATFHRYVIDANRDPAGTSLYPGQNTTGLIPETDFDGQSIWGEGLGPAQADVDERVAMFHAPYHAALRAEIERVKSVHGIALLYDCHSIRSRIPFLFEGQLPDFNIGTDGGVTCHRDIESAAAGILAAADDAGDEFTLILNGRFKGGWTTRHYGVPAKRVHAIQMELSQRNYLASEAPPFEYDSRKAERVRVHLKRLLVNLETIALRLSK